MRHKNGKASFVDAKLCHKDNRISIIYKCDNETVVIKDNILEMNTGLPCVNEICYPNEMNEEIKDELYVLKDIASDTEERLSFERVVSKVRAHRGTSQDDVFAFFE